MEGTTGETSLTPTHCDNVNKLRWDELVGVHMKSEFYRLDDFKSGALQSSLDKAILTDLAPYIDVKGKRILHLQCHFGQDTLSWLRLGAEFVVGVDYSPEAVKAATGLAAEMGYKDKAKFVCANVLELIGCAELTELPRFDLVVTNEGVLCWLSDLAPWAKVIKHFLEPTNGIFYIFEFHPIATIFDGEKGENPELEITYPYFNTGTPIEVDSPETYTDSADKLKHSKEFEWAHPISEIVGVLLGVGLNLKFLHEYPFTTYEQLPGVVEEEGSDGARFVFTDSLKTQAIPLMFSILASVK